MLADSEKYTKLLSKITKNHLLSRWSGCISEPIPEILLLNFITIKFGRRYKLWSEWRQPTLSPFTPHGLKNWTMRTGYLNFYTAEDTRRLFKRIQLTIQSLNCHRLVPFLSRRARVHPLHYALHLVTQAHPIRACSRTVNSVQEPSVKVTFYHQIQNVLECQTSLSTRWTTTWRTESSTIPSTWWFRWISVMLILSKATLTIETSRQVTALFPNLPV